MIALLFATLAGMANTLEIETKPTYLALGDSYTIGESVPEAERWPVQLAILKGWAPPTIVAKTGWTTDELSNAMDDAKLAPPYDRVSLLIGVNNQYRGRDVESYRPEFRALLDRAIELAGDDPERVFVLSIPDWGTTPFGAQSGRDVAQIARELDAYNAAAADIAKSRGVAFVDITDISREADAGVADDGLHPSGEQYRRWAERAAQSLK